MYPSNPIAKNHLSASTINIDQLVSFARQGTLFSLSLPQEEKVKRARSFLMEKLAAGHWVYGTNSGFGPLAGHDIAPVEQTANQLHLLYHLATGVGPLLAADQVRAMWALRLHQLSIGHSGISLDTLNRLIELFNLGIVPHVPSLGSVGASGDLTPLAHLALALCGEGRIAWRGEIFEGNTWFIKQQIAPIVWQEKEALAFVNGTACMTAIAALNQVALRQAIDLSLQQAFVFGELESAFLDAWHPLLSQIKPHPGQQLMAEQLFVWAKDSEWILPADRRKAKGRAKQLPQDPYSIRCIPQLLGAAWDQAVQHEHVVIREMNSASDNPSLFPEQDQILHGGNFNGQQLAFAADQLSQAVCFLAVYAERRIARICDPTLNEGLPAYLIRNKQGLHSGFMGAQVTASALTARLRSLAIPLAIQSIPTNLNNQDMVSMGTLAAWRGHECMEHLFQILAIEAMMLCEAVDIRIERQPKRRFSSQTKRWQSGIRRYFPPLMQDRPLSDEIHSLARQLQNFVC
ncbi:MAG: aromatic amino acid ammonia-lyase [Bacteroidota bacterium]